MKKIEANNFVPYDIEWGQKFSEEKNKILKEFLTDGIRIEHIGSTSVLGMESRPIIDIMIGLKEFDKNIKKVKYILKLNDYHEILNVIDLGERCFFVKENRNGKRGFTALIVKENGRLWKKNMEKRRLLLTSKTAREEYIDFKKKSIEECKGNLEEYSVSKEKYFS